jgi:hypothetical protein
MTFLSLDWPTIQMLSTQNLMANFLSRCCEKEREEEKAKEEVHEKFKGTTWPLELSGLPKRERDERMGLDGLWLYSLKRSPRMEIDLELQ